MSQYHHRVSGIFQQHAEAVTALLQLKEKGLPLKRMQIYEDNISVPKASTQGQSNEVLKSMFVKGIIGTIVGTGLAALAQIVFVSPNLTLFFASPLVAPISMLGWGASLGATIGAIIGAIKNGKRHPKKKDAWFSKLVGDAVVNDQVVLVVETRSQKETELAGEVMRLSVNNFKDISVA